MEYREALRLGPDRAAPHFGFAQVYERLGKTEDAMREYALAAEAKDIDPETRYDLGMYYAGKGQKERAMEHYRALKEEDREKAEELLRKIEKR